MSEELIPGTRVGRYQLLFRLGKGGMGEVWAAASHVSELSFQKLIALKVLRTKEMTSNAAKMFYDEAVAASALQHAAIVPTVDLGRDGEILFIAMDLVRGPSLTALLQRLVINKKHMSAAIVAHIGIQIASALDYAHERATVDGKPIRLVHRDVSPHNVLLDLNGSVRLMDFGVARTTIQTHESHVGTVRGKPSYMAPEQVMGGDIDARTDLFSLGIVLWESSCLKRLFGRSNPVKSMDAVLKHNPKPLAEMVPGFPAPLAAAIARSLTKEPQQRFQSASAFVDALTAASRSFPGMSTVERDLAQLIADNFPDDAFDVDGRVNEAMAGGALAESDIPEIEVELPGETRAMRVNQQRGGHMTFVGGLGTKVAWPTAHATDPLAPEAIEEARTQFAALTPSGLELLSGGAPFASPLVASADHVTPFSGTGQSMMQLQPQRSNMGLMIGALSMAAVVMLGTAYMVAQRGDAVTALEAVQPAPEVQAESSVRVTQKPEMADILRAAPAPVRAADQEPAVEAEPVQKAKRAAKRAPRDEERSDDVREGREGREPREPKVERERIVDATHKQVMDLIRKVKVIDPEAASQMMVTLAEAGTENVEKLNELRASANAILAIKSP